MTIEELVAELHGLGAECVYLFGSVANGTARPTSDADLFAVGPEEAQRRIDQRFGWERPVVVVSGVARRAHVLTPLVAGSDISAELFHRMQPEARCIG